MLYRADFTAECTVTDCTVQHIKRGQTDVAQMQGFSHVSIAKDGILRTFFHSADK